MAWALTIARFKVMESRRQRATSEQPLSEEVIENLCAVPLEDASTRPAPPPCESVWRKLAPRMQEVVRLRYFDEHRPLEIARLLSWGPNSVNVALSKARRLMYDCVLRQLKKA